MSNLLVIPFKKTSQVPIKQVVQEYLQVHTAFHPESFRWDIGRWVELRKEGVSEVIHVESVKRMLRYHAQLVSILTKLPPNISLDIPYTLAFSPKTAPTILPNLLFEQAAVLFNLAALYSQLGSHGDRSSLDGIKRALGYFQYAAGTLSFLISSVLPKLVYSPNDKLLPLDLSESFVKSLECLMLAQAQECVWQRAKLSPQNYKDSLIAKLATSVSNFYQSSIEAIYGSSSPIKRCFPSHWLPHLETKCHHFEAAAQYRASIDDLAANRYGHQLCRLAQAQSEAKKGYDIARRGGVSSSVLQDIKVLLDTVQKDLTRAERDNDLLYHDTVPASTALPFIEGSAVVHCVIPVGLQNLDAALAGEQMIFGNLPGWAAREAINIYDHRKETLLKEQIKDVVQSLDTEANDTLQKLNLPSSLEALEKSIGLPASLLGKAEEVRLKHGPEQIGTTIRDIQSLAQRNAEILEQAMEILDREASEDEKMRSNKSLTRLPSHEANSQLIEKAQRYQSILVKASESDEVVRNKWDGWEAIITQLTWKESDLEKSVPSSTGLSSVSAETRALAQELRKHIESLDSVLRSRRELSEMANDLAETDNVQSRVMRAASGFERWAEVEPAMFEDILDEEISKYDKFLQHLRESKGKQVQVLTSIEACNKTFLQSRREDPAVKDREHALQSLDLAYFKYQEILTNLNEGHKFYNELLDILSEFRDECKTWARARQQELHSLLRAMRTVSLDAPESKVKVKRPGRSKQPVTPPPEQTRPKLPSLYSDEWQTIEMPPPKSPTKARRRD